MSCASLPVAGRGGRHFGEPPPPPEPGPSPGPGTACHGRAAPRRLPPWGWPSGAVHPRFRRLERAPEPSGPSPSVSAASAGTGSRRRRRWILSARTRTAPARGAGNCWAGGRTLPPGEPRPAPRSAVARACGRPGRPAPLPPLWPPLSGWAAPSLALGSCPRPPLFRVRSARRGAPAPRPRPGRVGFGCSYGHVAGGSGRPRRGVVPPRLPPRWRCAEPPALGGAGLRLCYRGRSWRGPGGAAGSGSGAVCVGRRGGE